MEAGMAIKCTFAGIPVTDYQASLAWYERLLGRPPDVIVNDNEAMWQIVTAGWLYVVGDSARAGNGLFTVLVDDLEDHLAALTARGITAGAIEIAPGLYKKSVIPDLDGNTIGFGQDLSTI
jgi:catechol 2,3-dioxygenase-like lactoylglutathione lyase family enzyme